MDETTEVDPVESAIIVRSAQLRLAVEDLLAEHKKWPWGIGIPLGHVEALRSGLTTLKGGA